MKNQLIFMAAISLFTSGLQAGENSPAILQKLGAKQGVEVLNKGKMSEVRGELILPLNFGTSSTTIRLLEQGSVLRLTSTGSTNGSPNGSPGLSLLGIQLTQPQGPSTPTQHTSTLGVLDSNKVIYQTNGAP